MKNLSYKIALLSLIGGIAGGMPVLAQNAAGSDAIFSTDHKSSDLLSGKVAAVSDKSLVVDGKTVLVTDETSVIIDGKVGSVKDVKAGDDVKVTTSLSDSGELQAVSIEVTSAKS